MTRPRCATAGPPARHTEYAVWVASDYGSTRWMRQAACGDQPSQRDWFKGTKDGNANHELDICGGCIVRAQCLAYAIVQEEAGVPLYGIWGGLTRIQRRRLCAEREERRAARAAEHVA